MNRLDLLPLLTGDPNDPNDPLVKPARLKLSGRTKFKGRLTHEDGEHKHTMEQQQPSRSSAAAIASTRPDATAAAGKGLNGNSSSTRGAPERRGGLPSDSSGVLGGPGKAKVNGNGKAVGAEARRAGLLARCWRPVNLLTDTLGVRDGGSSANVVNGEERSSMAPLLQQPMNLTGDLSLVGLKLNQLSLARSLHGSLSASPPAGVQLNARGRPDEYLRVSAKLPTAPQPIISQEGDAAQGSSLFVQEKSNTSTSSSAAAKPVNTTTAAGTKAAAAAAASSVPAAAATVGTGGGVGENGVLEGVLDGGEASGALHVALRRGQLQGELRVSDNWTLVDVAGMPLDELELASLRGKVRCSRCRLSQTAHTCPAPRFVRHSV